MQTVATYNEKRHIEIQLVDDFGKVGISKVTKHLWGFDNEWLVDPETTCLFNDSNNPDNEVIKLFINMARGRVSIYA